MFNNDFDDFHDALSKGIVRFAFLKLDGELRDAYGTLNPASIPAAQRPKGKRTPPDSVFVYYDVQRSDWRCLRRDRFAGFVDTRGE